MFPNLKESHDEIKHASFKWANLRFLAPLQIINMRHWKANLRSTFCSYNIKLHSHNFIQTHEYLKTHMEHEKNLMIQQDRMDQEG